MATRKKTTPRARNKTTAAPATPLWQRVPRPDSPDFRDRTEGHAFPSPKCDDGEAVESVRLDTEAADE